MFLFRPDTRVGTKTLDSSRYYRSSATWISDRYLPWRGVGRLQQDLVSYANRYFIPVYGNRDWGWEGKVIFSREIQQRALPTRVVVHETEPCRRIRSNDFLCSSTADHDLENLVVHRLSFFPSFFFSFFLSFFFFSFDYSSFPSMIRRLILPVWHLSDHPIFDFPRKVKLLANVGCNTYCR